MELVCIDHPFHHHGGHSGYKMLGKFLGAEIINWRPKSSGVLDRVPEKVLKSYLNLHPNWYSKEALIIEWQLSKRLLLGSNSIFHFLYGEHSFRSTGKVNVLTGHKNRLVATYHQPPDFFEQRSKQFSISRELDAVVLVSTNQRGFFESILDRKKLCIIPHGVDVEFFCPGHISLIPREKYRCLTVGSNYRDINLHVEVIRKLNKTSLGSKLEFQILGEPRFSHLFSNISNVKYINAISDLALLQLYQGADLMLMPLNETTANNAILEAMACGLPLVVTDIGGVRDYVHDSFASLVPAHDADAMVAEVTSLLRNADRRFTMGRLARQRAKDNFSWDVISMEIKSLYQSLMS